jgi:DNA topoisomerase IB
LRTVSIEGPGIRRNRRGNGFSYLGPTGAILRDRDTLDRIHALAIPPAWTDVWICLEENGHIQAAGTDAAGRRQYLYHDRWRARRDEEKFDRMLRFARALPDLRERVGRDLARRGMPRDRSLACAVRLLDQAFFRVGSESYMKRNGSFGLATLRKDHVRVGRSVAVFDFRSKSGKRHVQEVRDPEVLPALRTMRRRRTGGRELLAYREGGRWRDLRSSDINAYIREAAGDDHTAKDFRTWHGTVLAAVSLGLQDGEDATGRPTKRRIAAAVREVAAFLGNTPAVARASYIDPRVIDRFEEGVTIRPTLERLRVDEPTDPVFREAVEAAVLDLLDERVETERAA